MHADEIRRRTARGPAGIPQRPPRPDWSPGVVPATKPRPLYPNRDKSTSAPGPTQILFADQSIPSAHDASSCIFQKPPVHPLATESNQVRELDVQMTSSKPAVTTQQDGTVTDMRICQPPSSRVFAATNLDTPGAGWPRHIAINTLHCTLLRSADRSMVTSRKVTLALTLRLRGTVTRGATFYTALPAPRHHRCASCGSRRARGSAGSRNIRDSHFRKFADVLRYLDNQYHSQLAMRSRARFERF
ncbi:hypothetical protein CERSUDRAFT_122044 [Gelatoporia subvermispora B]|uniref:Uncharacterized protein n=1 Tax=Ceriporiopsis subvermispora (strain B) TaxID=914234 RepID=M2RN58_CERS8|nr:hypothetical protein CERSUDRAFT_122044 [Gelatoporia subvermispora B]